MQIKRNARGILGGLALLLIALWPVTLTAAQEQALIEPQMVDAKADDGLTLVGAYYNAGDERPVVLLLHELYTTHSSWSPLIGPLLDAGYNVLAVDLRGYGATRGKINWQKAIADVQSWFNWLRAANTSDNLAVIGSSMGSNLALVGCANDAGCRTAIAISPGLNYYGVHTEAALAEGLSQRSALLIYSERDRYSALGVPQMLELASGEVGVHTYTGNRHGMDLFRTQGEDLIPRILDWLNTH